MLSLLPLVLLATIIIIGFVETKASADVPVSN